MAPELDIVYIIQKSEDAIKSAAESPDLQTLLQLREEFLSKSGILTSASKTIPNLSIDKRRNFGSKINFLKSELAKTIATSEQKIKWKNYDELGAEAYVGLPALFQSSGTIHPISFLASALRLRMQILGYLEVCGSQIESEQYNFDHLNTKENHPARDMSSTFYVESGKNFVLRTHTSPVQVRALEELGYPLKCFSIGQVYRRDDDATHTPMFTQMEILSVSQDSNLSAMKDAINNIIAAIFTLSDSNCSAPITWRMRRSYFPFTSPSFEVDVMLKGKWIEILGCGIVHEAVLASSNVTGVGGFAAGIGLERLLMIICGISDIRKLYSCTSVDLNYLFNLSGGLGVGFN